MAQIVGGFGVPHNPHFPLWVADGAPAAAEIERMYAGVAAHLRRVRPDVLLVFTADHYNTFFETVPIFAVGVAESAAGASDYPQLPRRVARIADGLARRVHAHAVRAGFDAAMSEELELDHTIVVPLHFLDRDRALPIVPVFVDGLIPPRPAAARCLAFGRAVADVDGLVAEATKERLAEAGNAGGELLEWIAMLGTIAPSRPAFVDVQPQFGHAYAASPVP